MIFITLKGTSHRPAMLLLLAAAIVLGLVVAPARSAATGAAFACGLCFALAITARWWWRR